ncbi:MAG: hypothetical protein WC809_20910 [Sinimarinibacterium sp.]|jgi:hypothetical protein
MIQSATSSALEGIRSGQRALERDASRVAQAGTTQPEQSPDEALLEAKADKAQVEASAKVLETADALIGSLLDVKA